MKIKQWIRSLNSEELAMALNVTTRCDYCIYNTRDSREHCPVNDCHKGIKKWLESEHVKTNPNE